MLRFIFIIFGLFASNAFAWPPEGAFCGFHYRYESYGLGIAQGYYNETVVVPIYDRVCFNLGVREGQSLHERFGSGCRGTLEDGARQGMRADILVIGSPSECYNDGYVVGSSFLSSFARLGRADQVGQGCVDAYRLGYHDAETSMGSSTGGNLEYFCYATGFNDQRVGFPLSR